MFKMIAHRQHLCYEGEEVDHKRLGKVERAHGHHIAHQRNIEQVFWNIKKRQDVIKKRQGVA